MFCSSSVYSSHLHYISSAVLHNSTPAIIINP
jgi:hypothetical protein